MRIIARPPLIRFSKRHHDAEQSIRAWYQEAKKADWKNGSGIKAMYQSASILKYGRVVFTICGDKYRLVVKIHYKSEIVYIRFIGTHPEYNQINAEII